MPEIPLKRPRLFRVALFSARASELVPPQAMSVTYWLRSDTENVPSMRDTDGNGRDVLSFLGLSVGFELLFDFQGD